MYERAHLTQPLGIAGHRAVQRERSTQLLLRWTRREPLGVPAIFRTRKYATHRASCGCRRRPPICTGHPPEMEVLTRIRTGNRNIEFALATTKRERAAVQAQRFRVYQRRGYYRAGLGVDRDDYDDKAAPFLAVLRDAALGTVLLGSARLILGEPHAEFRFPVERAFEFELPPPVAAIPPVQRIEVSRVVAQATRGIVIGGLLTPLGLMHAIWEYVWPRGSRAGVAVIKQRLLRALQGLGVALHEIEPAAVVYPKDGPLAGYYYHSGPVVPVYFTDTIGPSIERAIARYQGA
jgi:hypothetical protein